jgi:hypothetical protein
MSLLTRLFTHRVPLQISVPIVVACAAAGFFASSPDYGETARGASQMSSAVSQGPVATPTIVEPSQMTEQMLAENPPQPLAMAAVTLPPLDAAALPIPSIPTAAKVEPPAQEPAVKPEPPAPETKSPPARTRAAPSQQRSASTSRRSRRIAQQPASDPTTSSGSLKSIPLFGPMFSVLQ